MPLSAISAWVSMIEARLRPVAPIGLKTTSMKEPAPSVAELVFVMTAAVAP